MSGHSPLPRGASLLGDLPSFAAARFGEKAALITTDRELDFQEIYRLVSRLASGLRRLGIRPGERVALHLPNGWRWVVAYYAIARLGAIIVPANVLLTSDEVAHILADSGAVALIAASSRLEQLRDIPEIEALRVTIGDENTPTSLSIDALLGDDDVEDMPSAEADPESIAMIGYTSGTTGRPKGAVLTHRALTLNAQLTATMHGRSEHDRILTALPSAHIYGMLILNATFQTGATLTLLERFDAEHALDIVEDWQATVIDGVPTMYYYLLNSVSLDRRNLKSLRLCTVGGQSTPLPRLKEIERRLGCPLIEAWGMTEVAGIGLTHAFHAPGRLGSIGTPFPFVECRIASIEDPSQTAGPNERGELLVHGPIVMKGYWQRPDATREVLDDGGWLATGDIGVRDDDGYFFVVDRKKELIITAGYNIYPSEIERVIATHPGVAIVAVGAVPDDDKGEIAAAYIVLRDGALCTEDDLMSLCRANLAPYKIPRLIRFVSDLPKTSSGKIRRNQIGNFS